MKEWTVLEQLWREMTSSIVEFTEGVGRMFNGTMGALANLDYAAHGMDTESRPHLVTQEEEEAVEQEAGRKLSRAERRKMARDKKKKR